MNQISVVIPLLNERDTLEALVEGIQQNVTGNNQLNEILFVDDGSTDGSFELLKELSLKHPVIKVIRLAVNCGKADALDVGFRSVSGDIVITMDADLQDDPTEIPRFIEKINEGYDLVSGWKEHRLDPWHKTFPSKIFNAFVSRVFHLPLKDFNCGFKAYRGSLVKRIHIYGELHRFIPVIAKYLGARIAQISVKHHPRQHGKSKYGVERLLKGFLDLITVLVTTRYLKRPLHFFGFIGVGCSGLGGLMLTYLAGLWICGVRPIGNRPMLFYGMVLLLLGMQVLSLGIVAELFIRFNHQAVRPVIAETINKRQEDAEQHEG